MKKQELAIADLLAQKPLYDAGCALLLLKHRSKLPFTNGWQKGERLSWEEMLLRFNGHNLGIRLGEASKTKKGFVGVIDCDVKSKDQKHHTEMISFLNGVFPEWEKCPRVASGRGNGSMHIYVVTPEPFRGRTLAKSKDEVKVRMNGRVSAREKELLTAEEIDSGIKIRTAWEVTFMGEGRQAVLPPSIHPDSGNRYSWVIPFDLERLLEFKHPLFSVHKYQTVDEFESKQVYFKEVSSFDTRRLLIPPVVQRAITDGEGVSDRSLSLVNIGAELLIAQFDEKEICYLLSDPETFLGATAYEHRNVSVHEVNRNKACLWLTKYIIPKIHERSVFSHFTEISEEWEPKELSKKELAESETLFEADWGQKLERGGIDGTGKVKATLQNYVLIFENGTIPGVLWENLHTGDLIMRAGNPWGIPEGSSPTNTDLVTIRHWVQTHYSFDGGTNMVYDALSLVARKNGRHPIRDWLNSLEWDGIPRLESWLLNYTGAEEHPEYLGAVGTKFILAMVARAFRPGTKFDYMLVLQGEQGIGKSTLFKVLASPDYFSDMSLDFNNPVNTMMALRKSWLHEVAELASMRRVETNQMKSWLSMSVDRGRPAYGRVVEEIPRGWVVAGTTNDETFLIDQTGNRRYWCVTAAFCNTSGLAQVRDQLFAEAVVRYKKGEKLYLSDELEKRAKEVQETKVVDDPFVEKLSAYIEEHPEIKEGEFRVQRLFEKNYGVNIGPFADMNFDSFNIKHATMALKRLGFKNTRKKLNGKVVRLWQWKG